MVAHLYIDVWGKALTCDALGYFVPIPDGCDVKWIQNADLLVLIYLKLLAPDLVRTSVFCRWCVGRTTSPRVALYSINYKSCYSASGLECIPFQVFHYLHPG